MTEPPIVPADHITEEEAEAIAHFASEVAGYLSLPRYRFSVMTKPSHKDALASIKTISHRWVAEIRVHKDWMNRSSSERMAAIVHEVCHLLHRNVDHVINEEAGQFMHEHEHQPILRRYRRETELMVDYLAMFISDFSTVQQSWDNLHKTEEK